MIDRAVAHLVAARGALRHVEVALVGVSNVFDRSTEDVVFLEMNERAPFAPQTQASGEWMSAGLQVAPRLADACYSLRRDGPILTVASTHEQLPAEEAD